MIFGLFLGAIFGYLLSHFFEIVNEGINEKNQGEMIKRFIMLMLWIVVLAIALMYYQ